MTATTIRQKLYEYIRFADDKKVKAFYTIVADEANGIKEWWEDKKLLEKIKQCDADMESGKDKGITWPEAKKQLLKRGKKNTIKKEVHRTGKSKPIPEVKNIGLKEKIDEANRIFKSLKNPELLK